MDKVQTVLVHAGRTGLGLLIALVFSVIGIGIAWALFVFFGAASHATLLIVFVIGAGFGAGLGGYIAFLRIDRPPPPPMLLGIWSILLLTGIGGAWAGFQFGATREVECCVGPAVTPIGYTALGATVGAIAAALVMSVAHETKVWRGWPKFHSAAADSAIGASNNAERLPH